MHRKYIWTTITPSTISERHIPGDLQEDQMFTVYFSAGDQERIRSELANGGESRAVDKFDRECTFREIVY